MGVVMERWCPTQQMLGVFLRRILVKKLLLIGTVVLLTATSAHAQTLIRKDGLQKDGTWALADKGRFHGYLNTPLMPKCNPWVSSECARLYPTLFNKVPRPR